ncbi:MAG TPA: hypothetical protein VFP34_08650 [Microlunatus sp.]|nr:hypothetical protein [Microlunatus sp.]
MGTRRGSILSCILTTSILTTGILTAATTVADASTGPPAIQQLASQQTALLLSRYSEGQTASPTVCSEGQSAHGTQGVFLLPTLSFNPGDVRFTCRLHTQRVLVDLGGYVVTEDASGSTWTTVDGYDLTFSRDNLEQICDDVLRLLPAPAPAIIDNHPITGIQVATAPITSRIRPSAGALWQDSVNLGHPGTLAASFCGWKAELRLPPGPHHITVDLTDIAGGQTHLTYDIDVMPTR